MKASLLIFLSALIVSGCATHKTMVPVSGSKADGIVKMAYEYTPYESPIVNQEASRAQAAKRCQAWGYSDAEAFGTSSKRCVLNYGFGCEKFRVTTEYQCTGNQAAGNISLPQANTYQPYPGQATQQIIINIPSPTPAHGGVTLQPINKY